MWRSFGWLALAACGGGGDLAGTYDLMVAPDSCMYRQTFRAMTFSGDLVTVDNHPPVVLIDTNPGHRVELEDELIVDSVHVTVRSTFRFDGDADAISGTLSVSPNCLGDSPFTGEHR